MTLEIAVLVDVLVVLLCGGILLHKARLSHSHPATMYLLIHLLVVTFRATAVAYLHAPTLLSGLPGFWAIGEEELVRALLVADLALVAMTAGWIYAAHLYSDWLHAAPARPPMLLSRTVI